jgi:hypothetical protein
VDYRIDSRMDAPRYTLVRWLIGWLWFAVAAGIGAGIGVYYLARDLGGAGATALALVGGVAAATPYLTVIAMLVFLSEAAVGVTWITGFLEDHDPAGDEDDVPDPSN